MGVFNQTIDMTKIGAEMASIVSGWFNASIQIIDPNMGTADWDPWTNEQTGGDASVIWSGPARIQHLKNELLPSIAFSQESIRGIRVQIPLDEFAGFIRKGLRINIIDGGNDYELEQLQFVITSAINSSYAWIRTIEAEVDVKSVANG